MCKISGLSEFADAQARSKVPQQTPGGSGIMTGGLGKQTIHGLSQVSRHDVGDMMLATVTGGGPRPQSRANSPPSGGHNTRGLELNAQKD